ncbi:dTDP-4-dehydrorhamnose 3,5-epimerase family protein [Luteimonas terricola]|nr:dTDP-4-dehydrorhamnose 3,5-epimerase family protein [Luteimonas terricola]
MKLHATPLSGLVVVETKSVNDDRGSFTRVFCEASLRELHPSKDIPQVNLSVTYQRGTVRGMHYQRPPAAEAKLIRCLRGRVFDVAVDLRAGSKTFLHWHAVELDADKPLQVFIPEGFAHGFQALTDNVQLLYLHTAPWRREHEGGLRPDDPALAIEWRLAISLISDKDRTAPLIDHEFAGLQP